MISTRSSHFPVAIISLVLFGGPIAAQNQPAAKPTPIPSGANAKTNAEFRETFYRFYLKLAQDYEQHSTDDEQLKQLGIEFLTTVARKRALEVRSSNTDPSVLCRRLVDRGSTDVLIQQRLARYETLERDYETALTRLLDCDEKLKNSPYPDHVRMVNHFYLCSIGRLTGDEELLGKHFSPFVKLFADWIELECKTPENRRAVLKVALDMTAEFPSAERKTALLNEVGKRASLDSWFLLVFEGAMHISIGWTHRGVGFAGSVGTPNWETFGDHLEEARLRLTRAHAANPQFPEAAAYMITVAMAGEAMQSPRAWFDQAVAAEMDFPLAYERYTTALLPRWGGSHQEMHKFGLECMATKRFDTLVPLQQFFQVLMIEEEAGRSDRFWKHPTSYAKLKEMFEGYENAPEVAESHRGWIRPKRILSFFAAVAAKAEQWEDARRVLDKLDGRLLPEAMQAVQVGMFDASRAYAMTGDVRELVMEAEKTAANRPVTVESMNRAIGQLTDAEEKNTEEHAKLYFAAKMKRLEEMLAFESGEWVDLTFDEEMTGWRTRSGNWKMESEDSVIGERTGPDLELYYLPLEISTIHEFTTPYEVEVEVARISGSSMADSGIVIGNVSFDGSRGEHGRVCWVHADAAGMDEGVQRQEWLFSGDHFRSSAKAKRHLNVRVWATSLFMLVDHQGPYTIPGVPFAPGNRLGLSARHYSEADVARFQNFRVRKLPYGPLLEIADQATLIAESTKMIDLDPDDWFGRWVRGTTYHQQKQYAKALVDLQELQRIRPEMDGMLFYMAESFAATKQYAKAAEYFKRVVEKNPDYYYALRGWAEMELTAEDENFRDPQSALKHAADAHNKAQGYTDEQSWKYSSTLAKAHAALGDLNKAIRFADEAVVSAPPTSFQEAQSQLDDYRHRKRNSLHAAVAALLWEGDMTRRVIGFALLLILLAANLILIKKVARGRLLGAMAGMVGGAISVAIPAVLAVLIGLGEGPAFLKLLGGIVVIAAVLGTIAGLVIGGGRPPASPKEIAPE